jgi:hypothetical protein
LQKAHVENFSPEKSTKISISDVSFSSTFFVLSRFRVFLSDGSSKTLPKTFYKKNRVEKFLQQKSTEKQKKQDFFLDSFITFLGVSRWGEFKNTIKKYRGEKSDPGPFLASDPPTHHGGHRFVFGGPLVEQHHPDAWCTMHVGLLKILWVMTLCAFPGLARRMSSTGDWRARAAAVRLLHLPLRRVTRPSPSDLRLLARNAQKHKIQNSWHMTYWAGRQFFRQASKGKGKGKGRRRRRKKWRK